VYDLPEMASTGYRRKSSNRQFREFCHDMRQPVAGVLALAAAALDEPQVSAATLVRLRLIVEQTEWLAEIISHGLEAGEQLTEASHRTDARQAVNEAVASVQFSWPGEISIIAPAKAINVTVHPVVLRRSVANLLDNAIRAAGTKGTVRVTAGSCPGWALIAIEDDGPGFGNIAKGHGLGLSAVTRIVMKHGGRVECTRSSLGGACVSLWLPMAPGPRGPGHAWRLRQVSSRSLAGRAARLASSFVLHASAAARRSRRMAHSRSSSRPPVRDLRWLVPTRLSGKRLRLLNYGANDDAGRAVND
jgi:nitrogen-specific signal transduction histidine kinase